MNDGMGWRKKVNQKTKTQLSHLLEIENRENHETYRQKGSFAFAN